MTWSLPAPSILAVRAGACLLGSLAVLVLLSLRSVAGFSVHLVLSDSMQPSLRRGDLSIVRRLQPDQYRSGDIVSFYPPGRPKTSVTHRIDRLALRDGMRVAFTKGDANANGDPWSISMGSIQGKQVIRLPFLGYAVHLIKTQFGFSVFSLAVFFYFCGLEMRWWRSALIARSE